MTFHFADGNVNRITNAALDDLARIPEYKDLRNPNPKGVMERNIKHDGIHETVSGHTV